MKYSDYKPGDLVLMPKNIFGLSPPKTIMFLITKVKDGRIHIAPNINNISYFLCKMDALIEKEDEALLIINKLS